MKLNEDTPAVPAIETLRDQQAFFTTPKDGPTLQPDFERWFWCGIPIQNCDEASICCMGH
jgi:hypothetical protein